MRRQSQHQRRSAPTQPRRQLEQALPGQARSRAGNVFGALEQADTAIRKRRVAAGQADDGPRVAERKRSALAAAGDQPALEAGAIDAQRPVVLVLVGLHGDQVAGADQGIHARAVAAEQPGRLGHRHVRISLLGGR